MKTRQMQRAAVLILAWILSGCGYNQLQQMEENVFAAWDELETHLERQAELAMELLAAAKVSAFRDRRVLEELATARAAAVSLPISVEELASPREMARLNRAREELAAALADLGRLAAKEPELRTAPAVSNLLPQIGANAEEIRAARRHYNQEAEQFNAAIREFPFSLTNRLLLRLEPKEYVAARGATPHALPGKHPTEKEN